MSKVEEPAIIVKDIKKSFRIPLDKTSGIKQLFVNIFKRKKGYREFTALDGVSFEIKKGEFFGIVGRNGSGKSTLLKILAGVYSPDEGGVAINGSLTPFIELGVGFNPELSGRENVFLNGALLGFSRQEMEVMYDDIVDFAELHDFMEERLKNYSSGMQVRLAFSIAIRADTDILVLDEVLAVGDAAFQRKCNDYFQTIKSSNKTVVLVTHDMDNVDKYCDRALLLEDGKVKDVGSPESISREYTIDNLPSKATEKNKNLTHPVTALEVDLLTSKSLTTRDTLGFEIQYELSEEHTIDLGISIIRDGLSLVEHNTKSLTLSYEPNVRHKLRYEYSLEELNPGTYKVAVAIFDKDKFELIGFNTDACSFVINNNNQKTGGVLVKKGEWIQDVGR